MTAEQKLAIRYWIALNLANYAEMFSDDGAIIEIASQASKMLKDRHQQREAMERKLDEIKKKMEGAGNDGN